MRYVMAGALLALAAGSALLAYGPLRNLVSEYQDSPTGTYLLFGLPPLAVAIIALVAAARLLRRP